MYVAVVPVLHLNWLCFNSARRLTNFKEEEEIHRLHLTTLLTSASAERIFSTLRRFKNYLRSTISQEHLNHVVILHTHKEFTGDLHIEDITKKFVTFNEHRRHSYVSESLPDVDEVLVKKQVWLYNNSITI
uniref:HAT C-terminal dimerisation domain-containing protein n=1 Tax=Amphimedon queenslandica TaxID=400682 RepID=A0A1X7UIE4_AMPQE